MATFYGGEQLLSVQNFDGSLNNTGGVVTLYTVPSGRYARVKINVLSVNSGNIFGLALGSQGSVEVENDGSVNERVSGGQYLYELSGTTDRAYNTLGYVTLTAGETITGLAQQVGETGSYSFEVYEYAAP